MKLKIKRKGYQTGGTVRLELLTPEQRTQYNSLPTGADKEAYYNSLIDKDGYINGKPSGDIVDDNSSKSSIPYSQIGTAAMLATEPSGQDSTKAAIDTAASTATPWYGLAKTASNLAVGMTNTEDVVDPETGETVKVSTDKGSAVLNEAFVPAHEQALDDFKKGDYLHGIGELIGFTTIPDMIKAGVEGDKNSDLLRERDKKKNNAIAVQASENVDYVPRSGMAEGGHVSAAKAKEILRDGTANGKKLTDKQKRYFGWIAGGGKAEGGDVEGAGNGKSDSINTELPEGSFVVPVENAMVAQAIRDTYLPKQDGNMKKGGGVPVRLSNGEHVFTPEERVILEKRGIDLTVLAPNADRDNNYDTGGGVPYNRNMLIDEELNPRREDYSDFPTLDILTQEGNLNAEDIASGKATKEYEARKAQEEAYRKAEEQVNNQYAADANEAAVNAKMAELHNKKDQEEKQKKALLNAYDALGGTTGLLSLAQLGTGIGTSLAHKRPKYELDTDFLNRVKDSVASEKYGLSPAEKEGLLTDLTLRERNLKRYASEISGGDAATAFAIAKDAQANTARSLIDVAAKDAEIMRQKKARTDALTLNKAGMGRQQFEDDLRAFDQNQMAAQKLIDAGISNFVGNKQYQDAQKKMDERLATYGTADFFNPEDYMKAYRAQYGNQ